MRIFSLMTVAAMTISLGSCAALQKLSSTEGPYSAILVAGNGVDAAETTAKNYVVLCTPNPAPQGCDDALIKNKTVPAVRMLARLGMGRSSSSTTIRMQHSGHRP